MQKGMSMKQPTPRDAGGQLRRLRLLRGMKQQHVADLLDVTQATISRWERGELVPSSRQFAALMQHLRWAPLPAQDAVLKRLVESSATHVHLICDRTHRLLAASVPRRSEWRIDVTELVGRSLLSYASREILLAESTLAARGWFEDALRSLTVDTGPNQDAERPIRHGRMIWERIALADGSAARLVTTVD